MSSITRRDFIKGAAAAGAAIWLPTLGAGSVAAMGGGGGMGGGGMGGGMGVTVIDPPVGDALRQPSILPNETPGTGVVQVSVAAQRAVVDVNGMSGRLLTYNGLFPGPMIRARRNQLLRLNFTNALPDDGQTNILGHSTRVTNIHTHGLHVSPGINANGTFADYMLKLLNPGERCTYEYDLSKQPAGSLNFYHPHIHGTVTDQMWGGMSAPLVIEDEVSSLAPFAEKILVLKDISLTGIDPTPHTSQMQYMQGLEGSIVMVNGQVNPRLGIAPGEVQRWRIVNACTARFFRLSLQGHAMYVVGTDGGLLDRPYRVSELLLSPGERVDLLVRADQKAGSYKWVSLAYNRGMNPLQQVTLLTMTYSGSKQSQSLPAVVDPAAHRVVMDTASLPVKQIALTMGMGGGGMMGGGGTMGGGIGGSVGINGITYVDHEHCFTTMSQVGTWEVWEVTNSSMMDHPFHHHTNSAQVLSISGGDAGYASLYTTAPAWKDVTIVPAGGRIRLLMPVMDYAGMAMIHCHIIDHEDIGMMGIWHLMDEPMPVM